MVVGETGRGNYNSASGAFKISDPSGVSSSSSGTSPRSLSFDASIIIPTGPTNKPGSISLQACITY